MLSFPNVTFWTFERRNQPQNLKVQCVRILVDANQLAVAHFGPKFLC